ncbi:MAG: hypothetical protein HOB88_14280 [Bacteroidetes bacterium]|nr:hypothetical protein [Bacteroidota bacterium]
MRHVLIMMLIYLGAIFPLFSQDFNAEIRTSQKDIILKMKDTSFRNASKESAEYNSLDQDEISVSKPAEGFEWIAPFSAEDLRTKKMNETTLNEYDLAALVSNFTDSSQIEFIESQKVYKVEKEKGEYFKFIMEKIRKEEKESYTNMYKKVEKFSPELFKTYYVEPTDKPGLRKIPKLPKGTKVVYGLNYGKRKKNKLNLLYTTTAFVDLRLHGQEIATLTGIKRSFKYDESFEIVYTYEIGTPEEVYFYYTLYDANDGNTIAEYEYSIQEDKACSKVVHEKIDALTLPPGIYLLTIEMEMIKNSVDENQLLMEEIEIVY